MSMLGRKRRRERDPRTVPPGATPARHHGARIWSRTPRHKSSYTALTSAFRGGERTRTADFYVAKEESGHEAPRGAAKYQVAAARASKCHHMPRGTRAIDAP